MEITDKYSPPCWLTPERRPHYQRMRLLAAWQQPTKSGKHDSDSIVRFLKIQCHRGTCCPLITTEQFR